MPREIRDMICKEIASAAGIDITLCGDYCSYSLFLDETEFDGCIKMLHKWAPKSSVAKTAYEVILSGASYKAYWSYESKILIDPTIPLTMRFCADKGVDIFSGTSIDIRDCIMNMRVGVEMTGHLCIYEGKGDQANLVRLERELSKLCQLPRLRRVSIAVWTPLSSNAYESSMLFFERMSSVIKQLKKRVDGNISISTSRDLMRKMDYLDCIDPFDVSWMWDPPGSANEKNAKNCLAAVEERIKRLITNGVDSGDALTLVEELRVAAKQLPTAEADVWKMDDWSVGSGITKEKWLEIRNTRRWPM